MLLPHTLGREFGAALSAAALQNALPGFAGHTMHKAVPAGAFAGFGLIGSFWHTFSTVSHLSRQGQHEAARDLVGLVLPCCQIR